MCVRARVCLRVLTILPLHNTRGFSTVRNNNRRAFPPTCTISNPLVLTDRKSVV